MGMLTILLLLSVVFVLGDANGLVKTNRRRHLIHNHHNHHLGLNNRHNLMNWGHRNNHRFWNHRDGWGLLRGSGEWMGARLDQSSEEKYIHRPGWGARERHIHRPGWGARERYIHRPGWWSKERYFHRRDGSSEEKLMSWSSEERDDERRIMEKLIRHLRIEHPYRVCPHGWHGHGTHCYHYIPFKASWHHAERNCLLLGGNLASVHGPHQYHFLLSVIEKSGKK
uniref:C-type lectin domain-containing protein n=1 Tax=Esox lucius TaxID=8010 RepID=A0A6Q2WUQ8_ESOLU